MSTNPTARAWAEIDAQSLLNNARTVQSSIGPDARLLPMVKADAYGLGVTEAAQVLERTDPWGFGVATAEEGAQLRALGVTRPVVVVSPVPEGSLLTALESELQVGISSLDALRETADMAESLGSRAGVHLEVDTGMGRSGLDWRAVDTWGPPFRRPPVARCAGSVGTRTCTPPTRGRSRCTNSGVGCKARSSASAHLKASWFTY